MITLKEKKMLLKMKTAMGESVDELQAEIEAEESKLQEQSESRKSAFNDIFADLSKNLNELAVQDKKRSTEQQTLVEQLGALFNKMAADPQVPEEIKEEFVKIDEAPIEIVPAVEQPAPIEPPTTVDRVVSHVKETTAPSMFVQPNPPTVDKDIKAIQNKLKLLEGWVGKISMNGPGGGAVWLRDLDDISRSSVMGASNTQVLTYRADTKKWIAFDSTLDVITTNGNTTNNDITVNSVTAGHVTINTSAAYGVSTGQIAWNATDRTFDLGMYNGSILQVGQETFMLIKADENISDGDAVMFAGANGENILVRKYSPAVSGFIPEWFIGVATNTIAKNDFGYITLYGKVRDQNTLAWDVGTILWADNSVPGALTSTEPSAPHPKILVAAVTKKAGGNGTIMVRPSIRPRLHDLSDVVVTTPTNGQVLTYNANNGTWYPGSPTVAGSVESANNASYLGGIAANQYAYANQLATYTLPTANTSTLGGVKVDGTTITITDGVISSPNQDLSGYQTTAGLSANVATLASNNASYLGNVAANQYAYANGSNFNINNPLTVTYTPATTTGYAIATTGKDTQGGTGYFDFFKATNTTAGVTNGSKTFRVNSIGGVEIINSAYSATIMSLSDAGQMSTALPYQVAGKQAVNGPSFSAYPTSPAQTIASGSQTRVNMGNEEYDIGGCYDAPNGKFQPNIEGYYQLNATVRVDGSSGTGERMLVIYKNGVEHKRGTNESGTEAGASFFTMTVSCIVYANGTSDYFQLYAQQGSGANRTISEYQQISYFQGCMIRGA